jgi:hypothetical protein
VSRPAAQVFAAGDLSDPHGTHRTCLAAVLAALQQVSQEPWFGDCWVWLYRGAWQVRGRQGAVGPGVGCSASCMYVETTQRGQ